MKKILLLPVFYLLGVGAVHARMGSFVPSLAGVAASLSTDFSYLSEGKKSKRKVDYSYKNKNIGLQESLNFGTQGYVYHPNLFQFGASGNFSFRQAKTDTNGRKTSAENSFTAYSLDGLILQRKRYHGRIYHNKTATFLIDEITAPWESSRTGLEMFYEDLPWLSTFYYKQHRSQKEGDAETGNDDYNFRLSYRKRDFSEKIDYLLVSSGATFAEDKTRGNKSLHTFLGNSLRYNDKISFTTSFANGVSDGVTAKTKNISFGENIAAELPWNFELSTDFDFHKSSLVDKVDNQNDSQQEKSTGSVFLKQSLFDSLISTAKIKAIRDTSSQGSFMKNGYWLGTSYSKRVWKGSVSAGLDGYVGNSESGGKILVRDEVQHASAVDLDLDPLIETDTFTLFRDDADPETITVEVEIPNDDGTLVWVQLGRCVDLFCTGVGEDWSVDLAAQPLKITIEDGFKLLDIFVANPNTDPDTDYYNFRVNYSSIEADYVMENRLSSFNLGGQLLDGRLGLRYLHSLSEQEIIEGDPDILVLGQEVTRDQANVYYRTGPFNFDADYQILSAINKEKTASFNMSFFKPIALVEKISTSVHANYSTNKRWTESADGTETTGTGQNYSASINSSMRLPLPLFPVALSNSSGYSNSDRVIPEFRMNEDGRYAEVTQTKDVAEKYYTEFHLSCNSRIPKTKIVVRANGELTYENASPGSEVLTMNYEMSTGYRWVFGATTLSLDSTYTWERNAVTPANQPTYIDTINKFTLSSKLVRKFL